METGAVCPQRWGYCAVSRSDTIVMRGFNARFTKLTAISSQDDKVHPLYE